MMMALARHIPVQCFDSFWPMDARQIYRTECAKNVGIVGSATSAICGGPCNWTEDESARIRTILPRRLPRASAPKLVGLDELFPRRFITVHTP